MPNGPPINCRRRGIIGGFSTTRPTSGLISIRLLQIKPRGRVTIDANVVALEREVAMALGLHVKIQPVGRGGIVTIGCQSPEQLEDVIARLKTDPSR